MRRGIELNGIANIKLALGIMTTKHVDGRLTILEMDTETYEGIEKQLELLERYMLAFNKAALNGLPIPQWHEVRENPHLYPLHREIVD